MQLLRPVNKGYWTIVDILAAIFTIAGLSIFEMATSVDNAVVNADVLATMSPRGRRWFLVWGLLTSVFLVRTALPFLIVYSIRPDSGFTGVFTAILREDPSMIQAIEAASPPLFAAGGTFLVFLFLHWLFLEPKHYGLRGEEYIHRRGAWFYALVSLILTTLVWYSLQLNSPVAFGTAVGSSLFFITHGFRQNAEQREKEMLVDSRVSDWSKIMYLEIIDASFSIDGVLGAFAFTLSIPLIIVGVSIGALAVRQLTIRNIENVKRYRYLKNGAMYSVLFIGSVMISDAFGFHIPEWIPPVVTLAILGYFILRSWKALKSSSVQDSPVKLD